MSMRFDSHSFPPPPPPTRLAQEVVFKRPPCEPLPEDAHSPGLWFLNNQDKPMEEFPYPDDTRKTQDDLVFGFQDSDDQGVSSAWNFRRDPSSFLRMPPHAPLHQSSGQAATLGGRPAPQQQQLPPRSWLGPEVNPPRFQEPNPPRFQQPIKPPQQAFNFSSQSTSASGHGGASNKHDIEVPPGWYIWDEEHPGQDILDDDGIGLKNKQVGYQSSPAVKVDYDQGGTQDNGAAYQTVMIRGIPAKYNQLRLMKKINQLGFTGRFDFLYVPMDPKTHLGRGFAFVNFTSCDAAAAFHTALHGHTIHHLDTFYEIVCVPAKVQGFEANAKQFAGPREPERGSKRPYGKPLIFRAMPLYLQSNSVNIISSPKSFISNKDWHRQSYHPGRPAANVRHFDEFINGVSSGCDSAWLDQNAEQIQYPPYAGHDHLRFPHRYVDYE